MDHKNLFLIHIPKNMGTFIYKNYFNVFNKEYNEKYFGIYEGIEEYLQHKITSINNKIFPRGIPKTTISIDHLTLGELLELKILSEEDLNNKLFFSIMREPIERFISLCNYWDVPPEQLIYNITKLNILKETKYVLYQHLRPQADYIRDLQTRAPTNHRIFTMNDIEELEYFIKPFYPENYIVDFNDKIYHSREKYTIDTLTNQNMKFIRKYYKDDIKLWNQLLNQ